MKKADLCAQIIIASMLVSGCSSISTTSDISYTVENLELKFDRLKDSIPTSVTDNEYQWARNGDPESIKSVCTKLIDARQSQAKQWCEKLTDNDVFNYKAYLTLLYINDLLPAENAGITLLRLGDDSSENFQHTILKAWLAESSNSQTSGGLFLAAAYELDRLYRNNTLQYINAEIVVDRIRASNSLAQKISVYTEDTSAGIVATLDMQNLYVGDQAIQFCIDRASKHLQILAEQGDSEAQLQLALYYGNRWGFSQLKDQPTDSNLAYLWARKAVVNNLNDAAPFMWHFSTKTAEDAELVARAAEAGNVKSQTLLADYYFSRKQFDKALPWIKLGVARNDKLAMSRLGYMYVYGLAVTKNPILGATMLETPAREGEESSVALFDEVYTTEKAFKTQKSHLIDVLTDGANAGSKLAMGRLGQLLSENDPTSAKYWFRKAMSAGEMDVLSSYALLLMKEKSYEEAFLILRDAKTGHDPLSQYLLAACYMEGMGTKINKKQALIQLTKSAENFPYSQYVLGHSYMNGVSCVDQPDYKQARLYLETFLTNKNLTGLEKYKHEAEYMLAYLYHEGMGGEKDIEKFRHYAQRSCDGGELGACEWIRAEDAEVNSRQLNKDEVTHSQASEISRDRDLRDSESYADHLYHPEENTPNAEPQAQNKVKDFITDFFR